MSNGVGTLERPGQIAFFGFAVDIKYDEGAAPNDQADDDICKDSV